MDITFENVYKIALKTLVISGTHPNVPKDLTWVLRFFIIHSGFVMYLLLLSYNVIWFNLKDKDYMQICQNCVTASVISSASFLYFVLLYKKVFLNSLFKSVKSDFIKFKTQSKEDQEIVVKYAKKSVLVGQLWFMIGFGGCSTSIVKNIVLHTYYYLIGELKLVHPYDFIYPKIIEERKDFFIIYAILYVVFYLYSALSGIIYSAFSPLGPSFMLHACGQLEILATRLDKLFYQELSEQDIIAELKSIAIELQRIYNFVETIRDAFKEAYELMIRVTAIILPITVYELMEAFGNGQFSVEFVVFVIASIIISATPCYYSELLMEKGEIFRLKVYSCGWERTYDRRTRTMILLLLQRASRPLGIRTMLKTLSLDALTDVYRQSYALFNLMNAMWN